MTKKNQEMQPTTPLEADDPQVVEDGSGKNPTDLAETGKVLAEANEMLIEANAILEDAEAETGQILVDTGEIVNAELTAKVEELTETIDSLAQQSAQQQAIIQDYITQLSKAVVGQARILQSLNQRMASYEGMKQVTEQVPRTPIQGGLEGLAGSGVFEAVPGAKLTSQEVKELTGDTDTPLAGKSPAEMSMAGWGQHRRYNG